MFTVVSDALKQWNKTSDRHTKLQHIYLLGSICIVVLAGLVSLLNYDLGQNLLTIAALLFGIFIANAVAWALADSFIVSRISKRSTAKK